MTSKTRFKYKNLLQRFTKFSYLFGPGGEFLAGQWILKEKQINHDNHHDESKTRTHRSSKLPEDRDPWATLPKSGAKDKHQLNPGGPSNRQEALAPSD